MTDQTMTKIPPYTVVRLGTEHLDQLMDLQNRVLSKLPSNQDLIYAWSRDDFSHFLDHDRHFMLGVISDDGILVEKSAIIVPHAAEPETKLLGMKLHDSIERISVLAGSMSDPEVRGHNLMMKAVDEWMLTVKGLGRPHALTTVTRSNAPCWNPFLRKGFYIEDIAIDPADNSETFLIHRDLNKPESCECLHVLGDFSKAAKAGAPVEIVTPQTPMAKLKDLFNQGFVGVSPERDAANKYTGNIVFVPETAIVCHGQPKFCAP